MKKCLIALGAAAAIGLSAVADGEFSIPADEVQFLPSGEFICIFTGTAPTTMTLPGAITARVLAVGGGGAGGYHYAVRQGGGGGAGGFLDLPEVSLAAGTYTVSVGAGGERTQGQDSTNNGCGYPGADSFICLAGGADVVRAKGGGGGGRQKGDKPTAGGSGGGGASGNGAKGADGQGNAGGSGRSNSSGNGGVGGGGGGAAAPGGSAYSETIDGKTWFRAGAGGEGKISDITGDPVWYAGGGGGGATGQGNDRFWTGGAGGQGGGGQGGEYQSTLVEQSLLNGVNGTGGGGGGGAGKENYSGAGGSGIIVLRFPAPDFLPLATNVTVSALTGSSATFTGFFSPIGATVVPELRKAGEQDFVQLSDITLTEKGMQTADVGGLEAMTGYEVRFRLSSTDGETVSETVAFTTLRSADLPDAAVKTEEIVPGITHVRVPWRLLQIGTGATVKSAALDYGTDSSALDRRLTLSGVDEVGDYTAIVDGLDPATGYFARLTVVNSNEDAISVDFSFTTLARTTRLALSAEGASAEYRSGDYQVLVFSNVEAAATLTVESPGYAEMLLVGGGGKGGVLKGNQTGKIRGGSGGGAGGFVHLPAYMFATGEYAIEVGAGATAWVNNDLACTGEPTVLKTGGETLVQAYGGAGGARVGATSSTVPTGPYASGSGGAQGAGYLAQDLEQGNNGGSGNADRGISDSSQDGILGGSGGGGGAGAPGGNSTAPRAADDPEGHGGNGGDGRLCDITGEPVWYAGGGGGGVNGGFKHALPGLGGQGGGGQGASYNCSVAKEDMDGKPGTGGGGGGGACNDSSCNSGDGGSGIAVLRYVVAGDDKPAVALTAVNALPGGVGIRAVVLSEGAGNGVALRCEYGTDPTDLGTSAVLADRAYEGESEFSLYGLIADQTYYIRVVAVDAAGHEFATAAQTVVPLKSLLVSTPLVSQRTVTYRGKRLSTGDETFVVRPAIRVDGQYETVGGEDDKATLAPGDSDFSIEVRLEKFVTTYMLAFKVEVIQSGETEPSSSYFMDIGPVNTEDRAHYTWQAVEGEWNGAWNDSEHWTSDIDDCRGYPDSPDSIADFSSRTGELTVTVPGSFTVFEVKSPAGVTTSVTTPFTLRGTENGNGRLSIRNTLTVISGSMMDIVLDNLACSIDGTFSPWCGDAVVIRGRYGSLKLYVFSPVGNTRNPRFLFSVPEEGFETTPLTMTSNISLSGNAKLRFEVLPDSPFFRTGVRGDFRLLDKTQGNGINVNLIDDSDQPRPKRTSLHFGYTGAGNVNEVFATILPSGLMLIFR